MESNHTLQRRKLPSGAQVNAACYLSWRRRAIIPSRKENYKVKAAAIAQILGWKDRQFKTYRIYKINSI